jgi:hypothetical protein
MKPTTAQPADQLVWHWTAQLRPRLDGLAEGDWADHPLSELVLHINREVIHHGAGIACPRDYCAHQPTP